MKGNDELPPVDMARRLAEHVELFADDRWEWRSDDGVDYLTLEDGGVLAEFREALYCRAAAMLPYALAEVRRLQAERDEARLLTKSIYGTYGNEETVAAALRSWGKEYHMPWWDE